MTVPTFRFRIALPPHRDSAALFRELTEQMTRVVGAEPARAETARGVLARLVAARIEQAGATNEPVTVSFERPEEQGPITVELGGRGLPGEAAMASTAGLVVEQKDEQGPLRLSWTVHG